MKFYECDCGGDALVVEKWEDDGVVWVFSMWNHGTVHWGWKDRLRHIWHIIRKGHPWIDCVILSEQRVKELAKELADGA